MCLVFLTIVLINEIYFGTSACKLLTHGLKTV